MSIMVTRPADKAVVITPSNDTDLTDYTRGIYVGVSGDLTVDLVEEGTQITFVGLAAGIIHPIAAKRVRATGTDADEIIGILN